MPQNWISPELATLKRLECSTESGIDLMSDQPDSAGCTLTSPN